MITKKTIELVSVCSDAEIIAKSAHAAYWLSYSPGADESGGLGIQEREIIDHFKAIADKLGYRVEKIEAEEVA
jgi:hypothetical protein